MLKSLLFSCAFTSSCLGAQQAIINQKFPCQNEGSSAASTTTSPSPGQQSSSTVTTSGGGPAGGGTITVNNNAPQNSANCTTPSGGSSGNGSGSSGGSETGASGGAGGSSGNSGGTTSSGNGGGSGSASGSGSNSGSGGVVVNVNNNNQNNNTSSSSSSTEGQNCVQFQSNAIISCELPLTLLISGTSGSSSSSGGSSSSTCSADGGCWSFGGVGSVFTIPTNTTQLPEFASLTASVATSISLFDLVNQPTSAGWPALPSYTSWFAIQYSGYINVPSCDGANNICYYRLTSQDGAKFYMNGVLVINDDGLHASPASAVGSIAAVAGWHAFELDYFQGQETNFYLTLEVSTDGGSSYNIVAEQDLKYELRQ